MNNDNHSMSRLYRLLLILTLLSMCLTTHGSPSLRQHVTRVLLSPSDEISCTTFDGNGLLWVGTTNGLRRYDGYTLSSFKATAYAPDLLPNNDITCLAAEGREWLWVGTHNGLSRINLRTGRSRIYHLPRPIQHIIYTLFIANDSTLWVGTDWGLARYDRQRDRFADYDRSNTMLVTAKGQRYPVPGYSVKSIVEDRQGNLFIGTWEHGVYFLRRGTHELRQLALTNNSAYSLLLDSQQRLWVGSWSGVLTCVHNPYSRQALQTTAYNTGTTAFSAVYRIVEDKTADKIIAVTRGGLLEIDGRTPSACRYVENVEGENLKAAGWIDTDWQGTIWISRRPNELLQVSRIASPFTYWPIAPVILSFGHNMVGVQNIFADGNSTLWVGMHPMGIARLDLQTSHISVGNDIPELRGARNGVPWMSVNQFLRLSNGELWIASNGGWGVVAVKTGAPTEYLNPSNTNFVRDLVHTLCEDRRRVVWLGMRSGVSIVAVGQRRGTVLRMSEQGRDFTAADVRGICTDHEGWVWIATDNEGIIRVTGDSRRPQSLHYHQYDREHGSLPTNDVVRCFEDSHHRLWAISLSSGLLLYNKVDDRFEPKNRDYHIEGDRVMAINEDAEGNLWLTTDNALLRLTLRGDGTTSLVSYSSDNGLDNIFFIPNATARMGGRLFFGNRDGIVGFDQQAVKAVPHPRKARLILSDILINGASFSSLDSALAARISDCAPAYTREVTIPVGFNQFAFDFALLTYSNVKQNTYRYRLKGYDSDWRYCETGQRRAAFENIPSGRYELEVEAADSYGNWVRLPHAIRIRVLPPWWATWWAIVLYIVLGVAAVVYGMRRYRRNLYMKNQLQMNQVMVNVTHELLTPLAVINAAAEESSKEVGDKNGNFAIIRFNIERLTRLLRQILEVRKAQEGKLRLQVAPVDLVTFVGERCANLKPMMDQKSITLETQRPNGPIRAWIDSDKVDKMIYNLLSNAAKYTQEGGRVMLSLSTGSGDMGTQAVIRVEDNGIGISREKLRHLYTQFLDGDYRQMNTMGTGLGLAMTHDLVRLHHGTIDCQSRAGVGTAFTITLPIDRQAYTAEETAQEETISDATAPTITASATAITSSTTNTQTDGPTTNDGTKDYKLLIVEDNPDLLAIMARAFAHDYQVLTAKDGQQAWNLIQKRELDIVISDVMMPIMDGLELTRRIKQSDDYGQLPVILLTAKTTHDEQNEGYATGADAYITKPFRMGDLRLRAENILQNRERIRRRFSQQTDYHVEEQHYSSPDERFVRKAIDCVKAHLSDGNYDREQFASDLCVSQSTLYNKLRAITGQNVSGFIASIRLKESCAILRQQPDISISDLAYAVGFNTPKYFSKCFKKEFGLLPTEYITKLQTI